MNAKILEKQYRLITEDHTSIEDKISILQILSSKVTKNDQKEIESIIEDLKKELTKKTDIHYKNLIK